MAPAAIDPSAPRTLLAVLGGYSLVRSRDGGGTWAEIHRARGFFGITDILFDPARPGRVYVTSGSTAAS